MAAFAVIALVIATPVVAPAQGGALDGLGCHHNRTPGGYHCHQGPLAGQHFETRPDALDALTRLERHGSGLAEAALFDEQGRFGRSLQSLYVDQR